MIMHRGIRCILCTWTTIKGFGGEDWWANVALLIWRGGLVELGRSCHVVWESCLLGCGLCGERVLACCWLDSVLVCLFVLWFLAL